MPTEFSRSTEPLGSNKMDTVMLSCNKEKNSLSKLFRDSMAWMRSLMAGVAAMVAFSGCATVPRFPLENPYGTLEGAAVGEIVHVPTGVKVTKSQLLDVLGGSRVIYVGETHDNVFAHQVQLEIIKGLTALPRQGGGGDGGLSEALSGCP
jgi:hypothetical protein